MKTVRHHHRLSRRQFLGAAALLTTSLTLPGFKPGYAARRQDVLSTYTESYLDWLERPHLAPLNEEFEAATDGRTVGFVLYDLTNNQLLAAIKPESALPVASVFKAPVLMYFLDTISPTVWDSVPVEYWATKDRNAVPETYRTAWREHNAILFDLYYMIVTSDNPATGRVLAYIARTLGINNPIAAFNDWSHEEVGISQLSALSTWEQGVPAGYETSDRRYMGREANIDSRPRPYVNIMTARDLGLYYTWFLDQMNERQIVVGGAVLSIIHEDRRANVERLAYQNDGMSFSKNGSLGVDLSPAGMVITDAGIVQSGDGTTYLVTFLSVGGENRAVGNVFALADEVIKGAYPDAIAAARAAYAAELERENFFDLHLSNAYPEQAPIYDDRYNYGFVRYEGISAYSRPDERFTVRNPVISASRFGVHLLMQGALIRFVPLDATWVQLVPDSHTDNIRTRLSSEIYIKRADLWTISMEHVQPIDYFIDDSIIPANKFVVIDLGNRELIALENENAVFKTPIALNVDYTPRGTYPIYNKWLCRSMQAWAPGVPFTIFFHTEGYAMHGSPWQHWITTVNADNVKKRTSAGCVNIPNWVVSLGSYSRPMDELLFRWVGGVREAEREAHEYPTTDYAQMRVFAVDALRDLKQYNLPTKVAQSKTNWDRIIANIEYLPVTAPASFLVAEAASGG